jgi:hypothetical protein
MAAATRFFSTFDTRDLDKSQPDMNCGTHIITGGTGKYLVPRLWLWAWPTLLACERHSSL